MQDGNFRIRTMTREEVDLAVEWAAGEGWNPGVNDAACFHAADPTGFLVGLLNDEPIATISAIKYGRRFGFIGFYIVEPAYRGRGYGIQIWNAALKHLAGRTVGLDGVVAQQDNYKKSGFKLAYSNIRYEGRGGGDCRQRPEIVELRQLPFETVVSYDRPFFPADRTRFIKAWIARAGRTSLGIMHHDKLAGYGVVRKCRQGHKIGPLCADSPELAESLFEALTTQTGPAESLYLDTPEVNRAAVELAERHNMKAVFKTARMYTGEQPLLPLDRLFGVTSFELG